MDVQNTPPFGTEDEVLRVTRERIDVLGRGGYILAPTYNVQVDMLPAIIIAMYAEGRSVRSGKVDSDE